MTIENRFLKRLLKFLSSKPFKGNMRHGYELEYKNQVLTGRMYDNYSYKTMSVPADGEDSWKVHLDKLPNHKFNTIGMTEMSVTDVLTFSHGGLNVEYKLDTNPSPVEKLEERFGERHGDVRFILDPKKVIEVMKGIENPVEISSEERFGPVTIKNDQVLCYLMPISPAK